MQTFTHHELRDLRVGLDLAADTPDEEVLRRVERLAVAGWRLLPSALIERELAHAMRRVAHQLASEVSAMASRFDRVPDDELMAPGAAALRDELDQWRPGDDD